MNNSNKSTQTVLITGGSGLIGSTLTDLLLANNYIVSHIGRKKVSNNKVLSYQYDLHNGTFDAEAIAQADYIIHLAGPNLADSRWSKSRKNELIASRVVSGEMLFNALQEIPNHVKGVISASGIGYYGDTQEIFVDENMPCAKDFLADVCRQWESVIEKIATLNIRIVKLRLGVVLSEKGGALTPMTKAVKLYIGSPMGSGSQYISWIHIDDLCNLFLKAIEDEKMQGVYNACSPNPITNKNFIKTLAKILHKPLFPINVPSLILKIVFGEMASILLFGCKPSCDKIIKAGFKFQYPELDIALKNICI